MATKTKVEYDVKMNNKKIDIAFIIYDKYNYYVYN